MLGDFFTKPLTGSLFLTMRNICQGILPLSELQRKHELSSKQIKNPANSDLFVLKECVGEITENIQNEDFETKSEMQTKINLKKIK